MEKERTWKRLKSPLMRKSGHQLRRVRLKGKGFENLRSPTLTNWKRTLKR